MSDPPDPSPRVLHTVGHGAATQEAFTTLLTGVGVQCVVDVRRSPGSRRHPHFSREHLASWLAAAGIDYRWEERLGGRRSRVPGSPNTGLRDPAMQGYADHLRSRIFLAAIDQVLTETQERSVALLCAESAWTRCHRRLICDHVHLLTGVEVRHLRHDRHLDSHEPTPEARVVDGRLVYDGGAPSLDLGAEL